MTVKVKYDYFLDGSLEKYWTNEKEQRHRSDGPAIESSNGRKIWFNNLMCHREDGPAVVWEDGRHQYYLNNKEYSKKDYWEEIERLKKEREKK